jgi:hypothetical protein
MAAVAAKSFNACESAGKLLFAQIRWYIMRVSYALYGYECMHIIEWVRH